MYPDMYLYATLMEAEPFLLNDARLKTWADMYDRARAGVKNASFMAPSNLNVRIA
jgi:hypothetical protein